MRFKCVWTFGKAAKPTHVRIAYLFLYLPASLPWFVIFAIFGVIVIFGIFVIFVRPLSLLSFSDLLYLPVSLPWFVIFAIFGIVVIFGIFVIFVRPLALPSFSDLLYLPVSFPWFANFVIFGVIVIFGIFVTFVKPLSLLSFSDLLYLPVSLAWFVIFVIFYVIVIFGIFVMFVRPLSLLSYICQCRSLDLLFLRLRAFLDIMIFKNNFNKSHSICEKTVCLLSWHWTLDHIVTQESEFYRCHSVLCSPEHWTLVLCVPPSQPHKTI